MRSSACIGSSRGRSCLMACVHSRGLQVSGDDFVGGPVVPLFVWGRSPSEEALTGCRLAVHWPSSRCPGRDVVAQVLRMEQDLRPHLPDGDLWHGPRLDLIGARGARAAVEAGAHILGSSAHSEPAGQSHERRLPRPLGAKWQVLWREWCEIQSDHDPSQTRGRDNGDYATT